MFEKKSYGKKIIAYIHSGQAGGFLKTLSVLECQRGLLKRNPNKLFH